MIHKKEIKKNINFFYYDNFEFKIIEEFLNFIETEVKTQTKKVMKNQDGELYIKKILVDNTTINFFDGIACSLSIGINSVGVVIDKKIKPNTYYFIKNENIYSVNSPDEVELWN